MGKKNDTLSTAAAVPETPAPMPASTASPIPLDDRPGVVETTRSANGATAPTAAPLKKKAAARPAKARKPAARKAPAEKPMALLTEDIALRAYFIHEHRHRHGIHGDEHSDWVEAERQLQAELKKKTKRAAPSKRKKA